MHTDQEKQHPRDLQIESFSYELPEEKIARYPLEERDASRLLIYRGGALSEDRFSGISRHLPAHSLLVFNQTRVVQARLLFHKSTGGALEIFCLEPADSYPDIRTAMQETGSVLWKCLVRGAARWKPEQPALLPCPSGGFELRATLVEKPGDHCLVRFAWNNPDRCFAEVLEQAGLVPLPPYLHREAEAEDTTRYQTVFSSEDGSVAAPTAGLHFTSALIDSLTTSGHETARVTLHVGAGTFRPVQAETMEGHDMHAEWIDVDIHTLCLLASRLRKERPEIIATGTTTLRTLESLYWIGNALAQGNPLQPGAVTVSQWTPYHEQPAAAPADALEALISWLRAADLPSISARTSLLIAPGYRFRIATGLITNFHQPRSTLLLLVAAFAGKGWRAIYDYALQHGFRFLSYGDACLLRRD